MPAAYTAGDVMDTAAAFLNDANKALYSYTVQLPYLRSAHDELEALLLSDGINLQLKGSADISVAALATTVTLPSDLMVPISLFERPATSTDEDDFVEMTQQDILHYRPQESTLGNWSYANGVINLIGSTEAKDVRVIYWKSLADIVDGTTVEAVPRAKNFLAYKTAALCADFIGGKAAANRVMSLEVRAEKAYDLLSAIFVKGQQGVRKRRKPFVTRRFRTLLIP